MKAVWIGFALVLAILPCLSVPAAGRVPLLPADGTTPGELGTLMGGAQAALVTGGESLWYNPAGLAGETGTRLTLGGDLIRVRTAVIGGERQETTDMALGGMALAQVLGNPRRPPRFVVGLGLAQTTDLRVTTRIDSVRRGTAASLPPGLSAPVDVNAAFPDGLSLHEFGEAAGEVRVLSPSLALGIAPADWLRVGVGVRLDRVTLSQRLVETTLYGASANSGTDTLTGVSQLAWMLRGDALRTAWLAGVQMEMTPSLVLGLGVTLPSRTRDSAGRLHYQRSDRLSVRTSVPNLDTVQSETILIARDDQPFHLATPRRAQLGLAFRSDQFLIELDLYQVSAQAPYAVLPGAASDPPSTAPLALPELRTSGREVLGLALGMAFAQTQRTSLLLGLASDPSPVPPDDPLFRSVDFMSVSAGAYHVRGDVSGSLGVRWREGRQARARLPAPDGGEALAAEVRFEEFALQAGGSISF